MGACGKHAHGDGASPVFWLRHELLAFLLKGWGEAWHALVHAFRERLAQHLLLQEGGGGGAVMIGLWHQDLIQGTAFWRKHYIYVQERTQIRM